MKYNCT